MYTLTRHYSLILRIAVIAAAMLGSILLAGDPVAAQTGIDLAQQGVAEVAADAGLPQDSTVTLALNIVQAVLQVLGLIGLVLIIYGGFMMLTSAGNPEKVKTGRDVLVWAFIGITIILSSLAILSFIDSTIFGAGTTDTAPDLN